MLFHLKSLSAPLKTNLQGTSMPPWGKSWEYRQSSLTMQRIEPPLQMKTEQKNDIFLEV